MSCGHSHYLPLPPVTECSQTGRLVDELALAVHLGDVEPGAPLREVDLAEAHGVSRTIVRAALQKLEGQGLVEIVLNKGARVRKVEAGAVRELIELHAELFSTAASRAASRVPPGVLVRMHEFLDLMDHVAEDGGPPREFQHLRVGFARLLLEAAGPVWAERLRMATPVLPHHEFARADIEGAAAQTAVARDTRKILEALSARDIDAAARAARALMTHHGDLVSGLYARTRTVGRGDAAA